MRFPDDIRTLAQIEAFQKRQEAEGPMREHYKKIEGKRGQILKRVPALYYPVEKPCPLETGDQFTLGSHAVTIGEIRHIIVKPEDDEPSRREWRVELIHQEQALYLGTRPPTGLDTGRKSFSYGEEHGYETSDTLDSGSIIKPDEEDSPNYREREERLREHQKVKRAQGERIKLESRLNEVRKRGMTRTAKVVRMQLRKLDGRLDDAA